MTDAVTISRETLERAIEALELESTTPGLPTTNSAIAELRAALAIDGFGGNLDEAFGDQPVQPVEPVAWRDHVEQRILTWRQRTMNKSGDRLAIDDFMGQESIDDLLDFVCDEWAEPTKAADCGEAGHAEGRCGNAACLSSAPPAPAAVPPKLWLWKNFVDGRPEYWAFNNPFPVHLDDGDPQTIGEPCGYAIFKPSRQGRTDVSEAEVLRRIAAAGDKP